MKRFTLCMSALVLSLLLIGYGRAENLLENDRDELLQLAKKRRPKNGKMKVVHGHKTLSAREAKKIKNGKRLIHTTPHGHKAHALIKDGKIAGLEVKNKRGKQLAVKVHKQRGTKAPRGKGHLHRVSASLSDANNAVVFPAQLGGMFIVFSFVNPVDGSTVYVFFPANMVSPDLGGDDGGDDGGDTVV